MDTSDEIIKAFAQRVRQLREKRQISQEAFALQAGIDRSYFGKIERGDANPTLRQIALIAQAFGISIDKLFKPSVPRSR